MGADKRDIAKNAGCLMKNNKPGGAIMGDYERKLMEELDAQEIAINKKERKNRGYDYAGDGCWTRRSGSNETDEENY